MPATYDKIATQTLASPTATVTFSSIAATYTDIVAILAVRGANSANSGGAFYTVNNDTSSLYSGTRLYGNGTSALSVRDSNQAQNRLGEIVWNNAASGVFSACTVNLMNYSNTTTFKSFITRNSSTTTDTLIDQFVQLYRSTSAINRIDFNCGSSNWATGSTFTLYGIKAA
jgi:hypothetical protein